MLDWSLWVLGSLYSGCLKGPGYLKYKTGHAHCMHEMILYWPLKLIRRIEYTLSIIVRSSVTKYLNLA